MALGKGYLMQEEEFRAEVVRVIAVYERVTGHVAVRTHEMIRNLGEIEALSRLMISPNLQQGFRALRDQHLLHETFEAVVVRFHDLFRQDVVEAAQWRLDHAAQLLKD